MISFDDFKKMELKVARIAEVKEHPSADKLYILEVEIAGEKKQIIAGVKEHYTPEELTGKNIAVVTNLEPATIRGVESSGMMLAASDGSTMSILVLDRDMPTGSTIK